MKIGCDLDGTVFMTYEKMQEKYKRVRGKEFDLELVLDFNLARNPLDRLWLYQYFRDASNYGNLGTYPNTIYSLLKLKESHELYFLTIRPLIKKIQEITKQSIREIFEIPDDNIIFCKNFAHKLQVMREKRISVLIEDNLNSDPIPDDMMVVVLKRIWNSKKEINNPHIKVVEGWDEILKLLL